MASMDRVKAVTLNLWGEQPPLERRLALVIAGLRSLAPDVVALQEVREVPGRVPNTARAIAEALGFAAAYRTATPWGGGEEGLAILSPHAIEKVEAEELPHANQHERRIVLGATVMTPAGPLPVFTTHLNYQMTHGQIREDQVVAAETIVARAEGELPRLWMGDFNAVPDADEIRYLKGLRSVGGKRVFYQDAFQRVRPDDPGFTWAEKNPHTRPLQWLDTDRRIDYIFVSARSRDGRGRVNDCRIVFDVPDETGCYASDHFGLYADVQVTPLPT
jgi:endonuclease/exonuclease/phosphatase family metal-dependent hydrolase